MTQDCPTCCGIGFLTSSPTELDPGGRITCSRCEGEGVVAVYPDWVYVLTCGKYRSDVGDYVSPTVYISDDSALKATQSAMENDGGDYTRDEVAEDLGGEHVMMAFSNKEKTRTIWLEKLNVIT